MAEKSLKLNQRDLKGQQILVYISKDQIDETETNSRTIFLTNLPLTASETNIRELATSLLPPSIEIEEVRLIRDKAGKVKGFAYL